MAWVFGGKKFGQYTYEHWFDDDFVDIAEKSLKIRKITIDDYDQIYSLWINTPNMGLNNVDDSKTGIEKYLARNPETCFVAEKNNKIIGVILSGHDGNDFWEKLGFVTRDDLVYRNKAIVELERVDT